jgi:hypothetical protein
MLAKGFLANNATHGKYIQRVVLSNLQPNRRYCYEITSGRASSHILSFRTASLSIDLGIKDDNFYHTNFIVYGGDMSTISNEIKSSSHQQYETKTNKNNYTLTNGQQEIDSKLNSYSVRSLLIDSFKNQMFNKHINGFINLPKINLKEYIEEHGPNGKLIYSSYIKDFLDYYSEILSNVPVIPTIGRSSNIHFYDILDFDASFFYSLILNLKILSKPKI